MSNDVISNLLGNNPMAVINGISKLTGKQMNMNQIMEKINQVKNAVVDSTISGVVGACCNEYTGDKSTLVTDNKVQTCKNLFSNALPNVLSKLKADDIDKLYETIKTNIGH